MEWETRTVTLKKQAKVSYKVQNKRTFELKNEEIDFKNKPKEIQIGWNKLLKSWIKRDKMLFCEIKYIFNRVVVRTLDLTEASAVV